MKIKTIKDFISIFDKKMKIEVQITHFGMPTYYGDEPEGYDPPPDVSTSYYTKEEFLEKKSDCELQYYDFIEVYYDKDKHKTIINIIQDFDDYYKQQKELKEYDEQKRKNRSGQRI